MKMITDPYSHLPKPEPYQRLSSASGGNQLRNATALFRRLAAALLFVRAFLVLDFSLYVTFPSDGLTHSPLRSSSLGSFSQIAKQTDTHSCFSNRGALKAPEEADRSSVQS
jgi:hypothetical protein